MSQHRINAIAETRIRLIKLSFEKEWDDVLLDAEDEVLDHLANNVPEYMSEGYIGIGIYNIGDQAEPHFEFLIFNKDFPARSVLDGLPNSLPALDATQMDVRILEWEIINEGRMATIV